jgi:hypothetical protein
MGSGMTTSAVVTAMKPDNWMTRLARDARAGQAPMPGPMKRPKPMTRAIEMKLPLLTDLLQCECERLVFPVDGNIVEMHLRDGDCCEMTGAIKVAEMLRPEVKKILTFSGTKADTVYLKTGRRWGVQAR